MRNPCFSRSLLRKIALFAIIALVASSFTVLAQEKKEKKSKEPDRSYFKDWVKNEVAHIITDDELKAFQALKTDDEREGFIERFWLLRDPDPDTLVNEYKEEYYQRVAYANEHFTSGISGWKTARGRIYIVFGPPDQKESHPAGGSYDRPIHEGGGTTSTYPFEIWWYRHIEGVGSDVDIEFVDPTGSGEYRMAHSPDEKDALLNVPGAGKTLAEELGWITRADRIAGRGNPFQLAKHNQFERLERERDLSRPPRIKFTVLEKLARESEDPKITYELLPVSLRIDCLRVTENTAIVAFTAQMDNQDLVYKEIGGIHQAEANIFARITKVSGKPAGMFEDVVSSSYTQESLSAGLQAQSVYQKKVTLEPGRYKIDFVVRDTRSGRTGVVHHGFEVPKYREGELDASSLVLASKIEPNTNGRPSERFSLGRMKVVPNASGNFKADQTLGVYMQVYDVQLDQATLRPDLDVEYVITQQGREVARFKEDGRNSLSTLASQQVTLGRVIPLKGLKPGSYDLQVTVTDRVAGRTITRRETFQIQ
jgi:GWxTD domain-containing protein